MDIAPAVHFVLSVGAEGYDMESCPNLPIKGSNSNGECVSRRGCASIRLILSILALITLVSSTGCTLISSSVQVAVKDVQTWVDDSMSNYRDRTLAEKAWIRIRPEYRVHHYKSDLKKGFLAGYRAVASGGNGCTPPLAPSDYWGWKYQSPYGQAAVRAWFQGYPLGAKAADQDGVGHWSRVQLNIRDPQPFEALGETSEDLKSRPEELPQQPPTVLDPNESAPETESAPEALTASTTEDTAAISSSSDLPETPLSRIEQQSGDAESGFAMTADFASPVGDTVGSIKMAKPASDPTSDLWGDANPAVKLEMTGPGSVNGIIESPQSYDDWLRSQSGESAGGGEAQGAMEFQLHSRSDELPFTLE